MSFNDFKVSSVKNFVVSLFVVGYKTQGESIVILFRDDEKQKILFSMVVDCFVHEKVNVTRKILDKYGIKTLDAVCWTHPHWNHSYGIDELVHDYLSPSTTIFSPKFYYGNLKKDLLRSECKKTPGIFKSLREEVANNPNINDVWRTISASGDLSLNFTMQLSADDDVSVKKDIKFYFLTPIGNRTDEFALEGTEFDAPNELSISFIISLDGYNLFFGGDTEYGHAEDIQTSIVKSLRWIKVPHHCSLGGKSIAERIGPKLDFSTSTIYSKANLPVEDVQKMYASPEHPLYMTQLPNRKACVYGVVQYDYRFNSDNIDVDITTYGNAGAYTPK